MVDDFEVYTGQVVRGAIGPTVTIQRGGVIVLNNEAWEVLGEPEGVELLFSRTRRVIGFRTADPSLPHAYRTRQVASSAGRLISGKGFLKHYDITPPKAVRYPAQMVDNTLTVDLTADPIDSSKGAAKGSR